jgi:hypothetical protein
MSTLNNISAQRRAAMDAPHRYAHLRFPVPVFDAGRGHYVTVAWWDQTIGEPLADSALLLCQVQYLCNVESDAADATRGERPTHVAPQRELALTR